MTRRVSSSNVKSFLYCSDVDSHTVLLIIASYTLYMGLFHLCSFFVFFCMLTMAPQIGLIVFLLLTGFFLVFAVANAKRCLVVAAFWMLIACLVLEVVYIVTLNLSMECVCFESVWILDYTLYHVVVIIEYFLLGLLAGVNFILTLYFVLLLSDYLAKVNDASASENSDDSIELAV